MRKVCLLFLFCGLFLTGCLPFWQSVIIPRFSETSRQNVYATHDSLKNGRIELASDYSIQSIREIPPPTKRIPISPIIRPPKPGSSGPGQRVVIVPPELGGDPVIVVGSPEYEGLLKLASNARQLEIDLSNLKKAKEQTDQSLIAKQKEIEKMTATVNILTAENKEAKTDILKRDLVIAGMAVLIGLYVFVRVRGLFPLPF